MLEHFGLADDPVIRDEATRIYTSFQVAKWNNQRALDKIKAGGTARAPSCPPPSWP